MTVFFGIGVTGRFGNQIIEYMICKHLASIHQLTIHHARWLGTEFYKGQSSDPIVDSVDIEGIHMDTSTYKAMQFFRLHHLKMKEEATPTRKTFFDLGDDDRFFSVETDIRDKVIFHQPRVHLSYLNQNKAYLKSLFQYQAPYESVVNNLVFELKKSKTLTVLHVRKGDFDFMLNPYCVFVDRFYIDWLKQNFDTDTMSLYVCGHISAGLKKSLKSFAPTYLEDILDRHQELKDLHPHVDILIDHGLMRKADMVLASNSTFSFTACLLSDHESARFFRQDFDSKSLEPMDPWHSSSFELLPFGLKWIYLYFRYYPLFGFKFFYYVFGRLLSGKKLIDISYS
jgi:hypothetical protein